MTTALIGSTGFVGGTLLRQAAFDDLYHSRNIEEIVGRTYDLLVCAAMPAEKWKANREPERDRATLDRLTGCLAQVRAEQVVLISTVDVYPIPLGVDESTPIDPRAAAPYGRHRYLLEEFVRERFPATVVRLPGLFGPGLRKNAVFDLLTGNMLQAIAPDSVFQFYPLTRLWQDIATARAAGLPLVNFAVEGTSVREVAAEAFGMDFHNDTPRPAVRYDMRTLHHGLYGGAGGYMLGRGDVLAAMRAFVSQVRAGQV